MLSAVVALTVVVAVVAVAVAAGGSIPALKGWEQVRLLLPQRRTA